MKLFCLVISAGFFITMLPLAGQDPGSTSPSIGKCSIFPSNNIWNVPIDDLPIDQNSSAYVSTIGEQVNLHPDFGAGLWPPETGGPIGIPFVTVSRSQSRVPVAFLYDDESDPGPYPIPPNAPIEGGPGSDGDRHVLVLDQDNCILYELYNSFRQSGGLSWKADSGAIFDLNSNNLRPDGWTSADAAGLPILPGLVRYEEVAEGEIRHAIRFTAPKTRKAHIWPARHDASNLTGNEYPPMGQRFRLRSSFDISGYSPEIQIILRALKKYGVILADNGSPWYISGVPDDRWDNEVLAQLKTLKGSDFEAVNVSSLRIDPNSGVTNLEETGILYFPHLGNGTGSQIRYQTEMILVNRGGDCSLSVEFFKPDGSPWKIELVGYEPDSAFMFDLGRGHSLRLETTGDLLVEVGYARIRSNLDVSGTAVLKGSDANTGVTLFEAGIPVTNPAADSTVYLDSIGNRNTGIAFLNPPLMDHDQTTTIIGAAKIDLSLYDEDFNLIATTVLELKRGEYLPRFIHEIFSGAAPTETVLEMRGIVTVHSTTPLAVLTLRQGDDPRVQFPAEVPTLTAFPVIPGRPD